MDSKKFKNKTAKSFNSEATLNQFNTNTNVFSQLSAQYLSQKQDSTGDSAHTEFIKKTTSKKEISFAQYDSEMQNILNSLNKKSEITKLKALDQLIKYLDQQKEEFFVEFISTWAYMYKAFITSEYDRRILEEVNRVLLKIIEKNKKCIQKCFKEIFPFWFMCLNDHQNQEIQKVAEKAFNACFQQDKHIQALTFGMPNLIKSVQFYMSIKPSTIMKENIQLDEAQAEEISDRLTWTALLCVKKAVLIAQDKQETLQEVVTKFSEVLFQNVNSKTKKLVLIEILEEKKRPRVKSAALFAVNEILQNLTQEQLINETFIQNQDQKNSDDILKQFCASVLYLVDDKERLIQQALWQGSLIQVMKKMPEKIILKCDMKNLEIKVIEVVKKCAAGIGAPFYKNIIIFLSLLPQASVKNEVKEEKVKEKVQFLAKFFDVFLAGKDNEEIKFFQNELIQSYHECLYFVYLKRIFPVFENPKFSNMRKSLAQFVQKTGLAFVDLYINFNTPGKINNLYTVVPQCLGQLLMNFSSEDYNKEELNQKEEKINLGQLLVSPMLQEIENKFVKGVQELSISGGRFENLIQLFGKILYKVQNNNSICYEKLGQILDTVHSKMVENIAFSEKEQQTAKNVSILKEKIEFIQKYCNFSKLLGEMQDKQLVQQNILSSNKIENVFETVYQNIEFLVKKVQVFTANQSANIQFYESIFNYLSQILYSYSNNSNNSIQDKINPIFCKIFKFFKESVFSRFDLNIPQALPLVIAGFQIIQPNLESNFFSEFISFQKDKKKEETHMSRKILENERKHEKIINSTSQSLKNFSEYQEFIVFFAQKVFKEMKISGKIILPSIVCLQNSYMNQETQKTFLTENLQTYSDSLKSEVLNKKIQNYFILEKIEHLLILQNSNQKIHAKNSILLQNDFYYSNILEVVFYLYENKLKGRSGNYYRAIKFALKNNENVAKSFSQSMETIIEQNMNSIFLDNNMTQQNGELKLNQFLNFILDLFKFLKQEKQIIQQENLMIKMLNKKYFGNILFNVNNWKLIKILFSQIENLPQFLKKIFFLENQTAFSWLFANLVSFQSCSAIVDFIQLKKYFYDLSNDYIKPVFYEQLEQNSKESTQNVLNFLNQLFQFAIQDSFAYSNGLKLILKQILDQQLLSDSYITELFNLLIIKNQDQFNQKQQQQTQNIIRYGLIIKNLLPLFLKYDFIKDDEILLKTLKQTLVANLENLTEQNQIQVLVSLDLASVLIQDHIIENENQITTFLFSTFSNLFSSTETNNIVDKNYAIQVIFEYANTVIEHLSMQPFIEQLQILEKLFRKTLEYNAKQRKFSSEALSRILQFLRKVMTFIEVFSEDFKLFAITSVIDTGLIKFCPQPIQQQQQQEITQEKAEFQDRDEAYDNVIVEFAETISRFATIIDNNNFEENLVIELLNCKYPAIQKACFVLLQTFYENFVPQVGEVILEKKNNNITQQQQCTHQEEDQYDLLLEQIINPDLNLENLIHYLDCTNMLYQRGLLKENNTKNNNTIEDQKQQQQVLEGIEAEELEEDENEHDIVEPLTYGYLLTWITFINKINSVQTNVNYDLVKRVLLIYIDEHAILHKNFLTILFNCIDALQLSESEQKEILKPSEVSKIQADWSNFLSKESLFKLLIQSLYIFGTKFPSYLRQWIDNTQDKKFIKLSEYLIKTYISTAIFANEVEIIELSQHEWQSEEFTIYAQQNTREIIAVFTKESQKLEIYLKVPPEYPIKPIMTDIKRGVKVNQLKLNKWMLMMKSLLLNQNGNIKNILLTWKENLDKEFDGMEECPICYYVIHSATKELPKLPCKTCKYKFHSTCIHKWFNSSNKSECPMCKSQFL